MKMLKMHDLKTTIAIIDGVPVSVSYFYKREKNDINGNPRFRVHIIDADAPAVYETILKCYESQITELVKKYIENTEA